MKRAFPPTPTAYVPVDEILRRPRTRILLALRWLDWSTANEICDVLDVPRKSDDPRARNNYQQVLATLVNAGLVLREVQPRTSIRHQRGAYRYRLAPDVDLTIPPPTLDVDDWRCGRKEQREKPEKRDARKEVPPLWLRQWRARRAA